MKRILVALPCLMGGLALTLGAELSAGRASAAASAVNHARATANAAAVTRIDIALQVDGTPVTLRGEGECTFTDAGSIYELPARGWTATFSKDAHDVRFASWRVKADQRELMNLLVRVGATSHRVSTVKVGDNGQIAGSGSSTFNKAGANGGIFTIDATSDRGAKIKGRVTCAQFFPPEDNG